MKQASKMFLGTLCLLSASAAMADKGNDKSDDSGLQVKRRAYERLLVLAPGERGNIASVCLTGEVVVGGGPTNLPAALDIVYSSLFNDDTHSGWAVEWKNNGSTIVSAMPETSALCVKGKMTSY